MAGRVVRPAGARSHARGGVVTRRPHKASFTCRRRTIRSARRSNPILPARVRAGQAKGAGALGARPRWWISDVALTLTAHEVAAAPSSRWSARADRRRRGSLGHRRFSRLRAAGTAGTPNDFARAHRYGWRSRRVRTSPMSVAADIKIKASGQRPPAGWFCSDWVLSQGASGEHVVPAPRQVPVQSVCVATLQAPPL